MGQFAELTKYKNNIALKIITNENLVKALVNIDHDFINQSLPSGFNSVDLLYDRIFPYKFIPSIETSAQNFITMSFGNYKYVNNILKSGKVCFYIICHVSLLQTDHGLRYDYILDQIDLMFNKNSDVGVFKLMLDNGGDIFINENYSGAMIAYEFTDFQVR